jgi:hypothetical protein
MKTNEDIVNKADIWVQIGMGHIPITNKKQLMIEPKGAVPHICTKFTSDVER